MFLKFHLIKKPIIEEQERREHLDAINQSHGRLGVSLTVPLSTQVYKWASPHGMLWRVGGEVTSMNQYTIWGDSSTTND